MAKLEHVDRTEPGAEGDPRGSSTNSLVAEFIGDYNYAVATRTYGAAVWNDVRNAADAPAIDTYRQSLVEIDGTPPDLEKTFQRPSATRISTAGRSPDPPPLSALANLLGGFPKSRRARGSVSDGFRPGSCSELRSVPGNLRDAQG